MMQLETWEPVGERLAEMSQWTLSPGAGPFGDGAPIWAVISGDYATSLTEVPVPVRFFVTASDGEYCVGYLVVRERMSGLRSEHGEIELAALSDAQVLLVQDMHFEDVVDRRDASDDVMRMWVEKHAQEVS
ncbi:hypothetical protein [Nesterenkonia aerolata]|uniref:Uncharacterized protein n=1 Tax=Nesterenkonia aerolata TaxID=3074079 RepID=A0ABU2DT19_9MICC|nr:hypothetical protein [Nesterenkonia sp. LY-0111]MDR8019648.1 hypothetical protein [Nesterenkonia sp. LY-0111]